MNMDDVMTKIVFRKQQLLPSIVLTLLRPKLLYGIDVMQEVCQIQGAEKLNGRSPSEDAGSQEVQKHVF